MATQNEGPLDITIDTTETSTVVPMVADGHLCRWRLAKVSKTRAEKGPMVKLEYDLLEPAPNSEGGQIKPGEMGSKFFENIALFDKNTSPPNVPDWALKRLAQRQDALLGTGDPGNSKGKPPRATFNESVQQMIGKELVAKMKIRSGDFVGNEFASVYFPGDIAA